MEADNRSQKTSRQYKDSLFRTLFGIDKNFLELYNAVADSHFPAEFLKSHYGEVIKMLNYEYDAEAEKRVIIQEARQEGLEEGMEKGIESLAELLREGLSIEDALIKIKKKKE